MRATRWWLADLARAADQLSDEALSAIAAPMDYALESSKPGAPKEPTTAPGPPSAPVPGPPPPHAPARFWRVESAWFVGPLQEDGTEAPPPALEPLEEPAGGTLTAAPEPPEAEPWATRWPRIRRLLQRRAHGRAPDVRRLVRHVAKGEVVERIPRVSRLRWPDRVDVWMDRAPRLVPLLADQERLVGHLKQTLGEDRVHDVWLDAEGQRARAAAGQRMGPPEGGHPGATVLVLGDLGAGGAPEGARSVGPHRGVPAPGGHSGLCAGAHG